MAEMQFIVPRSLHDAIAALGEPGALAVAGGTSVGLLLRSGLIEPSCLVYLGQIEALTGIRVSEDAIEMGATTSLRELAADPRVEERLSSLAAAARAVGNVRVRSVATVGGALAHGDPRQDLLPVLLSMGAQVTVVGPSGKRTVELDGFFRGFLETVLGPGEVITAVTVPEGVGLRTSYIRYTPASRDDYPTVGVAVAVRRDGAGAVVSAAVALGGVASMPLLVPDAGVLLLQGQLDRDSTDAAASSVADACDPVDDQRGSANYKRAMVAVMTRRAIRACAS